jgi:calcium channel MID1
MPFPKLTPLQSRFAATFAATLFLIAVYYLVLSNTGGFAYAFDVDSVIQNARDHPLLIEGKLDREAAVAESAVTPRAPSALTSLGNNQFQHNNINIGETQWWVFPKDAVTGPKAPATAGLPAYVLANDRSSDEAITHELKKRWDEEDLDGDENEYGHGHVLSKRSIPVYISLNTCTQPDLNTSDPAAIQNGPPPPLQVYISTSQTVQKPGPGVNSPDQSVHTADGGYMAATVAADGDVYIAVAAPNTTAYSGIYTYQLAASIDAYFYNVDDTDPFLFFVDSDINSALLVTNNVTQSEPNSTNYQEWMHITPPYTIFANNINNTVITGLERSFCALNGLSQLRQGNNAIQVGMTNRGMGNKPKEQFYITGLNRSSTYYGILGMNGNSTASGNGVVGGGGKVWRPMNFTTKAGAYLSFLFALFPLFQKIFLTAYHTDDNCALLYNLSFCSEVAYAVPSNPALNLSGLSDIYDSNAAAIYQNFTYSLSIIPCNTSPTSMYSLSVGCDDCATAYKQWLCAVTIPRCYDFSSNFSYLQPRNAGQAFLNGSTLPADSSLLQSPVTNASRNPLIDSQIKPGPYKEILPCQDLCSDLVRTCPSSLGFSCPTGQWVNASYGFRDPNGDITCSYLGAAYYLNQSWKLTQGLSISLLALSAFWSVWTLLL